MGFAVFVHRMDPIYDDSPAEQYQFPRQYLARVKAAIGHWIVYYEPRKVLESRGYFAIARVGDVVPDPKVEGMFVATIVPGSYLDFPRPVGFRDAAGLVERGLLNERGGISGRAQAAVRGLAPQDFDRIVQLGLGDDEPLLPRIGDAMHEVGFAEEQVPYAFEVERDRTALLGSRVLRDRIFRKIVIGAYDNRCAFTGLRLINGGGRAEVEAAHIRPVEAKGPDIINNGIALSGTIHWMFDRGLISLDDDLRILVSRQLNDATAVSSLMNRDGFAKPPLKIQQRPHPAFLKWHRDNCFKG